MEAVFEGGNDVLSRIDALNREERTLRARLANIRREREGLKNNSSAYTRLTTRPDWFNSLPKEFWLPSYTSAKVFSNLGPAQDNNTVPPDLPDWHKNSSIPEFLWNLVVSAGIIVLGWQLLLILF